MACRWDAAVIIFVLYVALMLPPQIAFGNPQKINALRMIDFFVDMFFFVDVYVTLRTGEQSCLCDAALCLVLPRLAASYTYGMPLSHYRCIIKMAKNKQFES